MVMSTPTRPLWPTTMRTRLGDGRLMGTDGSLWLYRTVPLAPVLDARTGTEVLAAAEPLLVAFDELATLAQVRVNRRSASRSTYRKVHLLAVTVPRLWEPDPAHPDAAHLDAAFPTTVTDKRVVLLGVKLVDHVGGKAGWRAAVDSVVETMVHGGAPLSDYDKDTELVSHALARAGLSVPTGEDLRLANGWWNSGHHPDTPVLVHPEHLHVFASATAARLAHESGERDCAAWGEDLPGHHAVTFTSVDDVDLPYVDATSPRAAWLAALVDAGAVAVSVRAAVEPAALTRQQMRSQRKRYLEDIAEREREGKMERAEQMEAEARLAEVEALYSGPDAPPTLVDCSVIAAFSGLYDDPARLADGSAASLNTMAFRQQQAMAETMLCSPVRANPNLHDLPAQTIACAGLVSMNTVGDTTGALLGFTERDRQPSWLSPVAASTSDGLPVCLVAGATGAGKSLAMLNLADQFSRTGNPIVVLDPKAGSDHGPAVRAGGGQVYSLDSLAEADGVFDPVRFATTPEVGVEIAASMLATINPWGPMRDEYETPLTRALAYGVAAGGTCIGQALTIALAAGKAPEPMVRRVLDLAESSAMFRACVGVDPAGVGLRVADGITLIKVGGANLNLPAPGQLPENQQERIGVALVRMMVFGSAMALAGRDGVVMLDEAWVFLGAGRTEVERLGRLARSQRVLPMLFTQRVTDAVDAGLTGYISRGLILPIEDEAEARAACRLFRLEETPERIGRITAKATIGSGAGVAPNWSSMRALVEPGTRRVLRGAVAIYVDLANRAIPVEVTVPPAFLALASTNAIDIARRDSRRAA